MKVNDKKKFINICTITFKSFQHKVTPIQSRQTLWDFMTTSERTDKSYVVCCIPRLKSSKGIINIARKKVPAGMRLVVITNNFDEQDFEESIEKDYCLTTLVQIQDFNTRMLLAN